MRRSCHTDDALDGKVDDEPDGELEAEVALDGRFTAVAKPSASSTTIVYQPKSICQSFQPNFADDGFA
jgi:hypothetical protein